MLKVPVDKTSAWPVLEGIRKRRTRCTMFVFGDGAIADDAELRANSPLREVAFVENPEVVNGVDGYDAVNAARAAGAVVVTMTLKFDLSSALPPDDVDIDALDGAFEWAEVAS